MDTLFCPKCQEQKTFYTELKSNQNTARCNDCNSFIKNIPYEQPKFYVGKYKDKNIGDIDDINYLQWALANMSRLNTRTKEAITQRISQLEFLAK
jgi:hypothetical protein